MSEDQLLREVLGMGQRHGWMIYHPPDNRPIRARSGRVYVQNVRKGYPDLTLVHPETGTLGFAELKQEGKYPTVEQREWLAALAMHAAFAEVWRPRDLPRIARLLRTPGDAR